MYTHIWLQQDGACRAFEVPLILHIQIARLEEKGLSNDINSFIGLIKNLFVNSSRTTKELKDIISQKLALIIPETI